MRLNEILRDLEAVSVQGPASVEVTDVTGDSRLCREGSLFVAISGFERDGFEFIPGAVGKGAKVIVSERPPARDDVTWVVVRSTREAISSIAATFFGYPARELRIIGITGTSGKTTTTKMVESILDATGTPVGLIGTIGYRAGGIRESADRTTPDAIVLHRWFRTMVEEKVRFAVMEVSSHALALKRTAGVKFAAAVFTNLSRDHLDFHSDFEDYFAAKKILFEQIDRNARNAIVNIDDPYGERLLAELGGSGVAFGRSAAAEVRPSGDFMIDVNGLRGIVHTPWGDVRLESPLIGVPNLYNWLAAIASTLAVGVEREAVEEGIRQLESVRGRFERIIVPGAEEVTAFVDYAHKPDALEKLLRTTHEIAPGKEVIVVFGCGGDRDQGKRGMMGEIAARNADLTIVTSDNPRGEDPEAILQEIVAGLRQVPDARFETLLDRREAIERAVELAGGDSVVLVAGKGHENYQVIGDRILHFDDREELEHAIRKRKVQS
jgi:UDP-N-acetylmuramoyl-L-alanyl-D-glutamate--2,6-diaminopimelate ligase